MCEQEQIICGHPVKRVVFSDHHLVSDHGKVYRIRDGELFEIKPFERYQKGRDGKNTEESYSAVRLCVNGITKNYSVHRLVAEAFIPNPENLKCVNHLDGDKHNNDVANLEWCSNSQNTRHAYKTGLINLYRDKKSCTKCGVSIGDRNQSGLCAKCYHTAYCEERRGLSHTQTPET